MKGTLSFLLITLGAIGASIGVARTDTSVEGWVSTFQVDMTITVISLVVLVAGVVIKIRSDRAARAAEARHGGSLQVLRDASRQTVAELGKIDQELDSLDLDTLHARLDAVITGPIADFVDNRDAISHTYGLTEYAAVMTEFAPAERYLNRAWSASTDGYLEEAVASFRRALPNMSAAHQRLAALG